MWSAIDETGKLVYPNFVETVVRIVPMYWVRAIGGTLVFISFLVMMYNLYKTAKSGSTNDEEVFEAYALDESSVERNSTKHRKLEGMPTLFSVLSLIAILVGTGIELIPSILSNNYIERMDVIQPYTPLEVIGRDIYVREGCYLCHSQTIRPMAHEVLRYGKVSEAAEFVYDRPFQWGSKRTGPDLHRVGGKYSNLWHYRHFRKPQEVTAGSIMPRYTWLFDSKIDYKTLVKKLTVLRKLGTPYEDEEIATSVENAKEQALSIAEDLEQTGGIPIEVQEREVIALIAYMQRLGIDYGSLEPEEDEEEE